MDRLNLLVFEVDVGFIRRKSHDVSVERIRGEICDRNTNPQKPTSFLRDG
ncbi:hypothetical protein [Acaryochloris thomasi]|nr:hypothetical protein [Acaryochloris thomasi]